MFSKLGWQVNLFYFSISFLGGWIFMILYTIVIIINKLFKNSLSVACALNACIVWITTQQQRTTFASISLETQVALSALRSELPGLDSPRPGVRMGSLGFLSDKELECFLRWIKVLRLSSLGALRLKALFNLSFTEKPKSPDPLTGHPGISWAWVTWCHCCVIYHLPRQRLVFSSKSIQELQNLEGPIEPHSLIHHVLFEKMAQSSWWRNIS